MNVVGIVEYGVGNLDSVARAIEQCGGRPIISADPKVLAGADRLILPGVGAFGAGMRNLHQRGLVDVIRERAATVPLLGICLGMQLLAATGVEGGAVEGLALLPGEVVRLTPKVGERVPHVGWNDVRAIRPSKLFDDSLSGRDFYFVHGYHFRCARDEDVIATTDHCGGFSSIVGRDNVLGTQFHPEKSQRAGLAVLANFLRL